MAKTNLRAFILFSVVGAVGFLVDLSVLMMLIKFIGPVYARGVSFVSAVISTWVMNRTVTFSGYQSGLSLFAELFRYFLLMAVGGLINLSIYFLFVLHVQGWLGRPEISLIIGSAGGLFANFISSRYALFNKPIFHISEESGDN